MDLSVLKTIVLLAITISAANASRGKIYDRQDASTPCPTACSAAASEMLASLSSMSASFASESSSLSLAMEISLEASISSSMSSIMFSSILETMSSSAASAAETTAGGPSGDTSSTSTTSISETSASPSPADEVVFRNAAGSFTDEGCFIDLTGTGLPLMSRYNTATSNIKECLNTCSTVAPNAPYTYAGVEGSRCFCGDDVLPGALSLDCEGTSGPVKYKRQFVKRIGASINLFKFTVNPAGVPASSAQLASTTDETSFSSTPMSTSETTTSDSSFFFSSAEAFVSETLGFISEPTAASNPAPSTTEQIILESSGIAFPLEQPFSPSSTSSPTSPTVIEPATTSELVDFASASSSILNPSIESTDSLENGPARSSSTDKLISSTVDPNESPEPTSSRDESVESSTDIPDVDPPTISTAEPTEPPVTSDTSLQTSSVNEPEESLSTASEISSQRSITADDAEFFSTSDISPSPSTTAEASESSTFDTSFPITTATELLSPSEPTGSSTTELILLPSTTIETPESLESEPSTSALILATALSPNTLDFAASTSDFSIPTSVIEISEISVSLDSSTASSSDQSIPTPTSIQDPIAEENIESTTTSSSTILPTAICNSPSLINGGFEDGPFSLGWTQGAGTQNAVVRDTVESGNSAFGEYSLELSVYDGDNTMIFQTVTLCPSNSYTISVYGQVAPPLKAGQPRSICYLQICETGPGKCSSQVKLPENAWRRSVYRFEADANQMEAEIQVYVNCPGSVQERVNTVYLDEVKIVKSLG